MYKHVARCVAAAVLLALAGPAPSLAADFDDLEEVGYFDSPGPPMLRETVVVHPRSVIRETAVIERRPIVRQTVVIDRRPIIEKRVVVDRRPIVRRTVLVDRRSIVRRTVVVDRRPVIRQTAIVEPRPVFRRRYGMLVSGETEVDETRRTPSPGLPRRFSQIQTDAVAVANRLTLQLLAKRGA